MGDNKTTLSVCRTKECRYMGMGDCKFKSISIDENGCVDRVDKTTIEEDIVSKDKRSKILFGTHNQGLLIKTTLEDDLKANHSHIKICKEQTEAEYLVDKIRKAVMDYYDDIVVAPQHDGDGVVSASLSLCFKVQNILGMSWTNSMGTFKPTEKPEE